MKKRRITALMMTFLLTVGTVLAGCGSAAETPAASESTAAQEKTEEVQQTETEAAGEEAAAETGYYGNDISEHLDMKMYVIGDEPVMADEVEEAMNKILEEKVNVTLDINYIPLSDYTTKYSLLLASGEEIDIIYSASWADYFAEARKGAYQEITYDMIEKYMPQTNEGLSKVAYESIKVGGQIFMIPSNQMYANNAVPVIIRGDLREKYGMDPIDSYEDLEAYLQAVKDNEDSIYPYAAATDGVELCIQMYQCKYDMFPANSVGKYIGYYYSGNNKPASEDLIWQYTTDEYRAFVNQMKDWADRGFWSKNAVSNTISPADAFINGTSASVFWNYDTCNNIYNTVMGDHPEWKPEIVDPNPDGARFLAAFNQGLSLPAAAAHPERSLMVMDLLAWDKELYDVSRYGIEGEAWVATSDSTYELGERQSDYVVGNAPVTWGTKNDVLERIQGPAGSAKPDIWHQLFDDPIEEATAGFIFDDSNVKSEIAAVSELCSQYIPILELGLVDNPDAVLDEFNAKCEQIGRDKILEEFRAQYEEYLKNVSF